eukprot:g10966.t1
MNKFTKLACCCTGVLLFAADGQHQCHGFGLRHTRLLVFLTPQAKGQVQGTPLVLVRVQQFRFRALACSIMCLLVVWTAGRCGQDGGASVQLFWLATHEVAGVSYRKPKVKCSEHQPGAGESATA